MPKVAVLGAGSWGTALALQLARNGQRVTLWGHRRQHIDSLCAAGENVRYLPGVRFPDNLITSASLAETIEGAIFVLVSVPSRHFGALLHRLVPLLGDTALMWAVKGFEHGSARLLSQVFEAHFGKAHPHAVLAGPSFAREVAAGQPTAVTIAAASPHDPTFFATPFHGSNFLCYTSEDPIGAQIGAAVKNVIAIAAGIADGLGCGANTRAALVTRGLHEITRLAVALGGEAKTLAGLAGLGDLVLTATDDQSRNRRFGIALGRGASVAEARAQSCQTVEGEDAAHSAWTLAERHRVRMPISEHVHKVLSGELSLRTAFARLTQRSLKVERP